MNTKAIFYILTLGLIAFIVLKIVVWDDKDTIYSDNGDHKTRSDLGEETNNITDQHREKTSQSTGLSLSNTENVEADQLRYEDDWCSIYSDLKSADKDFAFQALKDDAADKGNIVVGKHGVREINLGQTELIKPYMESSLEDLYFNIENDNPNAIIASLNRKDIPYKKQISIAKRALILDINGYPLNLIVMSHILKAKRSFKLNDGKYGNESKDAILTALAYALYGIERHSINGLQEIAITYENDKLFKNPKFDPSQSFSDKDIENVINLVRKIEKDIDAKRAKKLMPPLNEVNSKITKHRFEQDLGLLFALQPEFTNRYSKMFSSYFPNLEKTSCVSKYAQQLSGKN